MKVTAVLLAAGQGTRMKSELQKVLHPICGRPMVSYALDAARHASTEIPVVVIGNGADAVRDFVGGSARCVIQDPQKGTGHAVMQAEALLRDQTDYVVVSYADMPLLRGESLHRLVETQKANRGPMTLLTVIAQDPRGFGRVIRTTDGTVQAVVEEAAATPEQLKLNELNVGAYCFSASWLWDALHRIPLSKKGEYYLTDTVELAVRDYLPVRAIVTEDLDEAIGVNTRIHLAEATRAMYRRVNQSLMLAGVTIVDPDTTYVEPAVTIGRDTTIWPNTHLRGKTTVGKKCTLGPNSIIEDTQIGSHVKVFASVLEKALVEDDVDMGPFIHLRKGAHLCRGVHMGNFGEVKNSTLGPGTKMGHFSYLGDTTTGENVNIGAGTITCNYDGVNKNPTEIGEEAFIGSDTMLVAPVKIGPRARTGAGAVVTKDVPEDTLVVGVPARVIRKLNEEKNEHSD